MDDELDEKSDNTVETASATTSAENSSGPFAYILGGIALAVSVFTLIFASSLPANIARRIAQLPAKDAIESPNDIEKHGSPISPDGKQDDSAQEHRAVSISTEEALSLDLAVSGVSIDAGIDAYVYANASQPVSAYVHEAARLDAACTETVDLLLRAAARDTDTAADKIAEAQQQVARCAEQIGALEAPDADDDVAAAIAEAQDALAERYGFMDSELNLLLAGDGIDLDSLVEADVQIRESTQSASDALIDALNASKVR